MIESARQITRQLKDNEPIPYHLLLLADETIEAIDKYIFDSDVYVLEQGAKMIAVYALFPSADNQIEIKNIAVDEAYQNQGIGKFLLKDAEEKAREKGCREIIIGTPDAAAKQISIYEKAGFRIYDIKKDFYVLNYKEPITEDEVQFRDMVMLRKILS